MPSCRLWITGRPLPAFYYCSIETGVLGCRVKTQVFTHFPQLSAAKVVIGVTALIVVYFLFTFAGNAIKAHQLNQQEGQLNAEIGSLQEKYQSLQALEQYLKSDEYIEEIAREQLGLVKPGETGIVAIPTQPSPTPAPDAPNSDLWWEVLIR